MKGVSVIMALIDTADAVFKPSNIKTKYKEIKIAKLTYRVGLPNAMNFFFACKPIIPKSRKKANKNLMAVIADGSISLATTDPNIKLPLTIIENSNIKKWPVMTDSLKKFFSFIDLALETQFTTFNERHRFNKENYYFPHFNAKRS